MLFISQVGCHLGFQRPFHQGLCQLPQHSVLAGQILRLLVVRQQSVHYFLFNRHVFSKSVGEPAITQSVLHPRLWTKPCRMPISARLDFRPWSRVDSITNRTAVYGPVRTVVWEGRRSDPPPYPDLRV